MARPERPGWIKALVAHAYKSAHVHHRLATSREKYSFQHRQIVAELHRGQSTEMVDLLDICDLMTLSSVASPISGEAWDAITHWHRDTSKLLTALPHIADQLCEECQAKVEQSRIVDVIEDADLTEAVSTVFDLLERVSKQGPAQRRRFLRILQDAKENGTTTTVRVSADGVPTAEHGGLTAGLASKDAS